MSKIRQNKGITLVALVITIIILLILAGITISSLTGSGLFEKAQDTKERTIKAQLKEEIEMAIQEIQIEELPKGNNVTLESLANGQLVAKLTEITADLGENEIIGEYKEYDYTIDSNFKIEIGGKVGGIKPTGTAEISTTGYIFEGNGTVQIKVTASIREGTITEIEAPNGATLTTDTSATEKIYTVSQNETYVFTIVGDSGRKANVTAKVENILSTPQIKIDEITTEGFRINVENNYPEGAITEYKYYVGDEIKSQGTTNKSCTVTGLAEDTEYSNIKVIAYINSSTSKESNIEKVSTNMVGEIPYSWDELSEIAKAISNDSIITSDTEEAQVTVNGETKTLKVGDLKRLDGKKVRILGFNHDTLTNPETAYGVTTETGQAGISFEYVGFLTTSAINTSGSNLDGWEACALRSDLNGDIYNSLSIKDYIKEVNKEYIKTYNVPSSKTTCSDYLWLLSCGEIWNTGYNGGITRGWAIATEGTQYKYYKAIIGDESFRNSEKLANIVKENGTAPWWLRSPVYNDRTRFCIVHKSGAGHAESPTKGSLFGVSPGFSI